MSRRLLLVPCFLFLSVATSARADEADSLRLVIETIESTDEPVMQAALLKGTLAGLSGRRNVTPPKAWLRVSTELRQSESGEVRKLTEQLAQVFGDKAALDAALRLVSDASADADRRRDALRSLVTVRDERLGALVPKLLSDSEVRVAAIRAAAVFPSDTTTARLLDSRGEWPEAARRASIEALASRVDTAKQLVAAIEREQISKDEIPTPTARKLDAMLGEDFRNVYGDVAGVAEDKVQAIAAWTAKLTPARLRTADASRGRAVYNKTCHACHKMYGEGGDVGPDITGSNRRNLDYLLLNILAPSDDVPESYRMTTVALEDGRVLSGVLAEEDATRIVLKTAEEPRVVVLKAEIEVRKLSDQSLMPDGQLQKLPKSDALDLIKYLRTDEQVPLP